jgi:hypothetical protein
MREGRRTLAFYAADTTRVAADQIDLRALDLALEFWRAATDGVASPDAQVLEWIRAQRLAGSFGNTPYPMPNRRPLPAPPSAAVDVARAVTGAKVLSFCKRVQAAAWKKEIPPQESRFRGFEVLLFGGGSRDRCFELSLRDLPMVGDVRRIPATPISTISPSHPDPTPCADRLAVAHGLALPEPLWPKFIEPSEVEPPPPPKAKPRPGPEDLGYDEA